MHTGRRYSLLQTLRWARKDIAIIVAYNVAVIMIQHFTHWEWMMIPWAPISVIGIAVAFYLGFKNNSSYERVWEARKIWGGIVNTSRSFSTLVCNYMGNETTAEPLAEDEIFVLKKRIIYRHIAWLWSLTYELRKLKPWEHNSADDKEYRALMGTEFSEKRYESLKDYISESDYNYLMTKGNKPSHLLNMQTKDLFELKHLGVIEHFNHIQMQDLITELYTLQGKSERIKNFPFPRQYATINFFFTVIFVGLLPFGMIDIFSSVGAHNIFWYAIPFSILCAWVFWMMELIGDASENPFEGLYNDVPITSMARGIEIDIREMLDEENVPVSYSAAAGSDIIM